MDEYPFRDSRKREWMCEQMPDECPDAHTWEDVFEMHMLLLVLACFGVVIAGIAGSTR
jgi:hypothetical protein